MTQVGVYDAKAKMSSLIERALAGEKITITVHGRPAVDLVPVASNEAGDRQRAVAEMLAVMRNRGKKRKAVSNADLKAAMEEGRR